MKVVSIFQVGLSGRVETPREILYFWSRDTILQPKNVTLLERPKSLFATNLKSERTPRRSDVR
jgi:hypothetical protein